MQKKKIVLKFSLSTGETKIEAVGFKGKSCLKATEFLEKTLGETTDFQKKAEWFQDTLEQVGTITTDLCF